MRPSCQKHGFTIQSDSIAPWKCYAIYEKFTGEFKQQSFLKRYCWNFSYFLESLVKLDASDNNSANHSRSFSCSSFSIRHSFRSLTKNVFGIYLGNVFFSFFSRRNLSRMCSADFSWNFEGYSSRNCLGSFCRILFIYLEVLRKTRLITLQEIQGNLAKFLQVFCVFWGYISFWKSLKKSSFSYKRNIPWWSSRHFFWSSSRLSQTTTLKITQHVPQDIL